MYKFICLRCERY